MRGAVQLEHLAAPRDLVQAVDILRDDTLNAAIGFPAREGAVSRVGLCMGELQVRFRPLTPVLDLRLRIAAILIEENRLGPRPDAAGRAKVRNAALSADAGAGEDHAPLGAAEPLGKLVRFGVHVEFFFRK